MIEKILQSFVEQGILGCILAFLAFLVWKLQSKLFEVVVNNTKAMTELCDVVHEIKEQKT